MSYHRQSLRHRMLAMLFLGCFGLGIVHDALAAGWYNMPTSLQQCIGYGYGPGYHSPMVLGPRLAAGTESKRVVYVPKAPSSLACSNGFCESSCLQPSYGTMSQSYYGTIAGEQNQFDGSQEISQFHPAGPIANPMARPQLMRLPVNSPSWQAQPTLAAPMNREGLSSEIEDFREAKKPYVVNGMRPWHR